MSNKANHQDQPALRHLHPTVYWTIIGLTVWYVIAIWIGFAGSFYTDYLLAVVTGFIFISIAVPVVAWTVWRRNRGHATKHRETFSDWASSEIDIGLCGNVKGTTAAIEILLPIAAITFGMIGFAIITFLAS